MSYTRQQGIVQKSVALVTGATSGIGAATAAAFCKNGSIVILSGRSLERGEACVKVLREAGGEAHFMQADVRDADAVKGVVDEIERRFQRLDFAFNNSGTIGNPASVHEMSIESIRETIETNILGTLFCLRSELPLIARSGGGAVVNNSSIAGHVGMPGLSDYVASKHAIVGMTKALALEWVKSNIRINAICPGGVDTPLQARFTESNADHLNDLAAAHPMGRLASSAEIAQTVVWLCSTKSSFITGASIPIDGGFLAQ